MKARIVTFIFLLVCFVPSLTYARTQKTYGDFHNVEYVRNYDGDTITFNIKGVHPIIGDKIRVRIDGIDTPELRAKCDEEKRLAIQAKDIVQHLMKNARQITLKNVGRGTYFRITATVLVDGQDIRDVLLKKGLAVRYLGGKKTHNWCD